MIVTASYLSSLSQSLHRWEIAEYIFEGLVIIACGGELVADLGRKCLTRAHRDRIERFSTILLVAALSMELICLVKTNELSGNVIGSLGEKAEEADKKAKKALDDSGLAITQSGEAVETSKRAIKEADEARAHVAEAHRLATSAAHGTAVITAELADRKLSDHQLKSIGRALEDFSGQEYQVVAYWDSKESVAIAERIKQALDLARWKFAPLAGRTTLPGGVVGIMVWEHPNADEKTKKAATLLVGALLREQLHAELRFQSPKNPNSNKLSLSVGAKR